ncbi:glycosyltransferase [Clostridium sp. MCC353]|uniref:glycosyltransferase n=1 Tax=Clostridium sp. MCC353 TaxID=2592646 RepID=UPI001C0387FE|nr:glycosyltransferase [Clostridium sp. MCC353]MBT9776254.1 glycosyltransferase [Clostridium sp. MCC353]
MVCGIVVFNPELSRLKANVEKLQEENVRIIFFVNGCNTECDKYIKTVENVIVLTQKENVGIATALNEIFKCAEKLGEKWVLTFDQDSIISDEFLLQMTNKAENTDESIACICPKIVDKRRIFPANKIVNYEGDEQYVQMCITSGSYTRIRAWSQVGKFDDYLFIDLVDNDFCKRLINSGWKILRLNTVELNQEFGNIEPRSEKTVARIKSICNKIQNKKLAVNISKFSYKKKVSPLRVYYTNRNIIYLNKKLKNYGGIGYESYSSKSYVGFIISFMVPSVLRAHDKKAVLKATMSGIKDGMRSKAVEWLA